MKTKLVVIGAGPGGYTAAFRAADVGLEVVLVNERYGIRLTRVVPASERMKHL